MSIKRRKSAFTLVEVLIFVVITSMVVAAGAVLAHTFMRSVAFLTNSVDLDTKSRLAIDRVSREFRQCEGIQAVSSNSIALKVGGTVTTYVREPDTRELKRVVSDKATGTVLEKETVLRQCDYVRFDLFKRNSTTGAYDNYPPASNPNEAKIVQVQWVCSRDLLGFKANTTTMQSAKVVIRKQ